MTRPRLQLCWGFQAESGDATRRSAACGEAESIYSFEKGRKKKEKTGDVRRVSDSPAHPGLPQRAPHSGVRRSPSASSPENRRHEWVKLKREPSFENGKKILFFCPFILNVKKVKNRSEWKKLGVLKLRGNEGKNIEWENVFYCLLK